MGFFGSFAGGLAQGVQNGMKIADWMQQREIQDMHKEGMEKSAKEADEINSNRFKMAVDTTDASGAPKTEVASFADSSMRDHQNAAMNTAMDESNWKNGHMTDEALRKVYNEYGMAWNEGSETAPAKGSNDAVAKSTAPQPQAPQPAASGVKISAAPEPAKIKQTALDAQGSPSVEPAQASNAVTSEPAVDQKYDLSKQWSTLEAPLSRNPGGMEISITGGEQVPANAPISVGGMKSRAFDTPEVSASDIFAKKYAKGIQDKLFAQGKVKEAEAFKQWSQDSASQSYLNAWSNAATLHMNGDDIGAMNALVPLYNNKVPDGMYVRTIPTLGEDGKPTGQYTVEQRRSDNNALVGKHTGDLKNIVQMGIGALNPADQIKTMMNLDAEKRKLHTVGAGESLVDSTGKPIYTAPPKPQADNEYAKYKNVLDAEIQSGNMTKQAAGKLWKEFLERKAQGQVINNNFGNASTITTDNNGNLLSVQAGKDGKTRVIPLGVSDPDWSRKRTEEANRLIADKGAYGSKFRFLARNPEWRSGIMNMINRDMEVSKLSPQAAVDRALNHYQGYKDFMTKFEAAGSKDEKEAVRKQAHEAGYRNF